MKNTIKRYLLNGTFIAVALLTGSVHASEVIADWKFSDPNQTRLNATSNTGSGIGGPGGSWNVAITGVETNGAGALGIRNDGKGGSGTRGAYADFGSNTDQVSGGLLLRVVGCPPAQACMGSPSLSRVGVVQAPREETAGP